MAENYSDDQGQIKMSDQTTDEIDAQLKALVNDRDTLRLRLKGVACEVCWASAWAPCENGTPDAVRDPHNENSWMVCQLCFSDSEARRWRTDAERLAENMRSLLDAMDDNIDMTDSLRASIYRGSEKALKAHIANQGQE